MEEIRKLAVFLLLGACASSCLAERGVSAGELEQLVAGARSKPDAKVAQQLSELELTERLSPARFSRVDAELPGPESRRWLVILSDLSAFRSLPASEIPATPAPDVAAQRQMIARTVEYAIKTVSSLPNFFATRETTRFENLPQGHLGGASLVAYQQLHVVGTSSVSVLYRDGHEVVDAKAAKSKNTGLTSEGLNTRGVFGPILSIVLVDAAQGKLGWSHWEQGATGPVAVFRYSIPREKSHYEVEFCCVRGNGPNGLFQQFPGYHGLLSVDLASGAILRLTIEADVKPSDPVLISEAAVEYDPVEIGGKTYIAPAKSVSVLVSPPLDRRGFIDASGEGSFTGKDGQIAPEHVKIWLNDAVFSKYHVFHADTRLVAGNNEASGNSEVNSGSETGTSPGADIGEAENSASRDTGDASSAATSKAALFAPATTESATTPNPSPAAPAQPAKVGLPDSEITLAAATELPNTPDQSSSEAGFSLRLNARLVDIGVVAYDKKGHPVTGLTASDFEIYDNGRKQILRFFGQTVDAAAKPGTPTPEAPEQATFSNRRVAANVGGAESNTTILLIDTANLAWPDLTNARNQMLHFLRGLSANDRVALYILQARSFQVLQEATTDHVRLATDLSQWMPTAQDLARSQEMEQRDRQQIDNVRSSADLQSVNGNVSSTADTATTVDPKLRANGDNPLRNTAPILMEVARHLAAIPGHKNLVWVSSDNVLVNWTDIAAGHDKEGTHVDELVLRAQEALNDAHVSIDPLDASQPETAAVDSSLENMNVTVAPGTMTGPTPQGGAAKTGRITAGMQQDLHGIQPAVQGLAAATGGRAFRRSSDLLAELNQTVADGRATYLLSFTPDTLADDQYHQLIVKMPGVRGVTLRYRTGYQYSKEPVTLKDRVREAISQPLDVNDIAVSANPAESARGATLKLRIATSDLALTQKDDRWIGKLDIFLVQREETGAHPRVSGERVALRLLPATYQEALKSGMPFDQQVSSEQKTGSIRVVVIDEDSGRIGTVTVPATAMLGKWR